MKLLHGWIEVCFWGSCGLEKDPIWYPEGCVVSGLGESCNFSAIKIAYQFYRKWTSIGFLKMWCTFSNTLSYIVQTVEFKSRWRGYCMCVTTVSVCISCVSLNCFWMWLIHKQLFTPYSECLLCTEEVFAGVIFRAAEMKSRDWIGTVLGSPMQSVQCRRHECPTRATVQMEFCWPELGGEPDGTCLNVDSRLNPVEYSGQH